MGPLLVINSRGFERMGIGFAACLPSIHDRLPLVLTGALFGSGIHPVPHSAGDSGQIDSTPSSRGGPDWSKDNPSPCQQLVLQRAVTPLGPLTHVDHVK